MVESFKDLDCWQNARSLRIEISKLTTIWPADERYSLIDQIRRSSRSVTTNIAEGYGRHHHQENIQFCRQARGSLTETLNRLITAFDEAYINSQTLE